MSLFGPVRLERRGGGIQLIATLSDAKTAGGRLGGQRAARGRTTVSNLIDEATAGYVSPQVAFNALQNWRSPKVSPPKLKRPQLGKRLPVMQAFRTSRAVQ